MAMARKPVICLVGGIGSGKSLVAAVLARHGGFVIAGDLLGHEALRQPEVRRRVLERWGHALLDEHNEIDRRRLGKIVFASAAELRVLETLVFPWIERRIGEEIATAQASAGYPFIVLDAAVLLEAGWNKACDRLVFVDAPRSLRWKRLKEKRGWSEKEVEARESAQMPLTEKRSHADTVINNAGPPEEVDRQMVALLQKWGLAPP
jgi:dephospho-CoA kinase